MLLRRLVGGLQTACREENRYETWEMSRPVDTANGKCRVIYKGVFSKPRFAATQRLVRGKNNDVLSQVGGNLIVSGVADTKCVRGEAHRSLKRSHSGGMP